MSAIITEIPIAIRVGRLKQSIQWFPSTIFNVPRQSGKTQAILELANTMFGGQVVVMCIDRNMAHHASERYRQLFPKSPAPKFTADWKQARDVRWPILVDDWWELALETRDRVMATGRVIGRVGTER